MDELFVVNLFVIESSGGPLQHQSVVTLQWSKHVLIYLFIYYVTLAAAHAECFLLPMQKLSDLSKATLGVSGSLGAGRLSY